jgi:hypothetical protein
LSAPADPFADIEELAARFVDATLPRSEWTHLAHLAVGTWHVQRYGLDEALARLRIGIRRLNDSHGTLNSATSGYHETVTRAYVALLAQFVERCPAGMETRERVLIAINGPLADRDVLLRFYSRDRLLSASARAEWIEPDLAPLLLSALER